MSTKQYDRIYLFSPFLRIFHWVMAVCIFLLFATGLYIGDPFFIGTQGLEPTYAVARVFSMENMRLVHFFAAYTLVAAFILRIYGFIINKGDRLFPHFWTRQYWTGMMETSMHYMFIRYRHRPYLRNPLARSSYVGLYLFVVIEGLTGFAMYAAIDPNSWSAKLFHFMITLLGSEYNVHLVHHIVAWLIMMFVIGHVYMAFRADMMEGEGEVSSMVNGYKYLKEEPDDLGDVQ